MGTGKAKGFTYLGLLLLIAIGGIGLAVVGQVWHTESQREREKELLFIGEQYAKAIGSYYENTPNGPKQYPPSLQELLLDKRFPVVRHHLRKLYHDPVTGGAEWGLVKDQGRITGVYSLSRTRPLKNRGFPILWATFSSAKHYDAWQFVYTPDTNLNGQPANLQLSQGVDEQPRVGNVAATDTAASVGAGSQGSDSKIADGASTIPKASSEDPDASKKQACLRQRGADVTLCAQYCKGLSALAAECSLCMTSVSVRYRACLSGYDLPTLYGGS